MALLIHRSSLHLTWRKIFQQNFRDFGSLADFLQLTPSQRLEVLTDPNFPFNVPLRLAQKMEKGSLADPLVRQFIPLKSEVISTGGFIADPIGDCASKKSPKLLHKYKGRALLVCTGACAMHCRYCFRQHFDYEQEDKTFEEEINLIKLDSSIQEVILSGRDPLSLSDRILESLLEKLSAIPHIQRIRFHTRFIIGIPERVDEAFLSLLKAIPKQIIFVTHINHPREMDADVLQSIKNLKEIGIVLLNQSVLLKGVNDTFETLLELSEQLVNCGIMPYYLHQLDKVAGSAHFEVSEEIGKKLIQELNKSLPGYAVPKYVREVAGEPSKIPI